MSNPWPYVDVQTRTAIYDRLAEEQGGEWCAICGSPQPDGRRLAIDHDHNCCPAGMFCEDCARGLLCNRCNIGIGAFLEDLRLLESAALYVQGRPALGCVRG